MTVLLERPTCRVQAQEAHQHLGDLIIAANHYADAHEVQLLQQPCCYLLALVCTTEQTALWCKLYLNTNIFAGQQVTRSQLPLAIVRQEVACQNTLVGKMWLSRMLYHTSVPYVAQHSMPES